ncbi:hypothetical protein ECEPECC34262_5496 [Escherichia coli EPEC C342-62]|nr:hypothetical protein ECEPECC34262_5496 [Escherichia coli EPEC C342-62]
MAIAGALAAASTLPRVSASNAVEVVFSYSYPLSRCIYQHIADAFKTIY